MRFPILFAVILTATPALAQSSGSDAATGLAGVIGMFGLFGFLVAVVYSILLFFLPFMVWGCLRRLTSIRDEIRGFRKNLAALRGDPAATDQSWYLKQLAEKVKENEAKAKPPVSLTFENAE